MKQYESKQFTSERVYNNIKEAIIKRRFLPGERLVEADLLKEFSCSRTTIRGVLRRLTDEGLVEYLPNKGVRVYRLTEKELLDIHIVLKTLVSEAAWLTAEKHMPQDIEKLQECIENYEKEIDASHNMAAGKWSTEYILCLADASGNFQLVKLIRQYYEIIYSNFIIQDLSWAPIHFSLARNQLKTYKNILSAIQMGDVERASSLMRDSFEMGTIQLMEQAQKYHPLSPNYD